MYTLETKRIEDVYFAKLIYSNYYQYNDQPLSILEKSFQEKEDYKRWFLDNSITFLTGTFDIFCKCSKMAAPFIFHKNYGGNNQERNIWMENYWRLKEMYQDFYNASSVFKKCEMILNKVDLLRYSVPFDDRLERELIIEMAKDLVKSAKTIKKILERDHSQSNQKFLQRFEKENIEMFSKMAVNA